MKFHEWLRTRSFHVLKGLPPDHPVSDWIETVYEGYTYGIYTYGETGFIEEMFESVMIDKIKRYTCMFYNDEFSSEHLHEVEAWLYEQIVDEHGWNDPDPMLDPQLG